MRTNAEAKKKYLTGWSVATRFLIEEMETPHLTRGIIQLSLRQAIDRRGSINRPPHPDPWLDGWDDALLAAKGGQ